MTDLRSIPRTAVDAYLRVARLPFDLAARRRDGDGRAELVIDRVDASARAVASRLLRDDVMQEDARRRLLAVDERERASRLRAEAERTRVEVTARAEHQRDEERARAERAETKRKQASRKAAAAREKVIDEQERAARLEQLDAETHAVAERERALGAEQRAEALGDAAVATKAARARK